MAEVQDNMVHTYWFQAEVPKTRKAVGVEEDKQVWVEGHSLAWDIQIS